METVIGNTTIPYVLFLVSIPISERETCPIAQVVC